MGLLRRIKQASNLGMPGIHVKVQYCHTLPTNVASSQGLCRVLNTENVV